MTTDTTLEELIRIVKFGTPFESLRAAQEIASRARRVRKPHNLRETNEFEELIRQVRQGSLFESLRAAHRLAELSKRKGKGSKTPEDELREINAAVGTVWYPREDFDPEANYLLPPD